MIASMIVRSLDMGILLKDSRAAVYLRVSNDARRGTIREEASVTEQHDEATRAATALGVTIVKTYKDNDISASRFSKKTREDWQRMLSDIEADELDMVIMWESTRGSRTLTHWSQFLDACRVHCPIIHIVSDDVTYDVRKPRDWRILADEGVSAAADSDRKSLSIKRTKAAARADGRPDGRYPFGWRREYDSRTGVLLHQVPDPVEAPVVLEILQRVLSGEAMLSIARDLARRCELPHDNPQWVPKSKRGYVWRPDSVRRTVINPAHIGKRWGENDTDVLDAAWEGFLPEDQWWAVYRKLTESGRRAARPGKTKYLLTGIMTCDKCGAIAGVSHISRAPRYSCRGIFADGSPTQYAGCATVKMVWADDLIRDLVIKRVSKPDVFLDAVAEDNAAAVQARAKAQELRARLDVMWSYTKNGDITMEQYMDAKRTLRPEIDAAEVTAETSGLPPILRSVAEMVRQYSRKEASSIVEEAWDNDIPLGGKREIIRAIFSEIRLRPGGRGVKTFDPSRIIVVPRQINRT